MMGQVHSFDQKALSLLSDIMAEIEGEYAAQGHPLSEASRAELAHRIMDLAATGETDRATIKAHAVGKSFAELG
jgi:hypothetical protein